jgi:hypothetical protein
MEAPPRRISRDRLALLVVCGVIALLVVAALVTSSYANRIFCSGPAVLGTDGRAPCTGRNADGSYRYWYSPEP